MNTAGRLLSIIDKLTRKGGQQDAQMVKIWGSVFNLEVEDNQRLEDEVVTCLMALRNELDLLGIKLADRGVPTDLLHPGLRNLRNIASTTMLHTTWQQQKEAISRAENRLCFAWADWALQDESEEEMSEEELATLKNELASLEKSLHETDMTSYLRDFVQRQIDSIRSALRIYHIQGVKPIDDALTSVTGSCMREGKRLKAEEAKSSESAKGVIAKTGDLIRKTAEVADRLDKIARFGERAYWLGAGTIPLLLAVGNKVS